MGRGDVSNGGYLNINSALSGGASWAFVAPTGVEFAARRATATGSLLPFADRAAVDLGGGDGSGRVHRRAAYVGLERARGRVAKVHSIGRNRARLRIEDQS